MKSELDKQLKDILQKQSQVDKLIAQTHQKQMELQRQIELNRAEVPHIPLIDVFAAGANKNLQHELLTLLSGNRQVAIRLLNQQQTLNSGRSVNWCLEKVIYDLKRDRH
ncbi:hypothetical protein [Nostoc sp.]|uniref:hypothetical protein n=1 Tax=Nostoc sp. TaxID=1180 RepID=UPI002FF995FA